MKINMIVYPAMVGMLLMSCENKEKDEYGEAVEQEVANQGREDDNYTLENSESDATLQSGLLGDTLQLPDPLMIVLERSDATSPDKILGVRKYTENGIDYYEIKFDNPVEEMQQITYDDLGRIKSPNLKEDN